MNRTVVITFVVLAFIAGAVLFGPTVVEVIDDILTPEDEMSTLVEFHDEDGNLIDVPMAITAGGDVVTTMTVTASWTVEGENIEPGTFNLHGEIKIGLLNQDTFKIYTISTHSFDSSEYISSESHTWVLADLLPMADQDIGWILEIKAIFTPTATDLEGNPVEPGATTTTPISATLSWDEGVPGEPGTLNIIQCAVTKAYPP